LLPEGAPAPDRFFRQWQTWNSQFRDWQAARILFHRQRTKGSTKKGQKEGEEGMKNLDFHGAQWSLRGGSNPSVPVRKINSLFQSAASKSKGNDLSSVVEVAVLPLSWLFLYRLINRARPSMKESKNEGITVSTFTKKSP